LIYNKMAGNKKGVSLVVSTLILVLLVMTATGVVWVSVKEIVKGKIEETESCFGNFEKVTINNEYTCYNFSSGEFQFSINIGDADVSEVLVSVSGKGSAESFKINKEGVREIFLREHGSGKNFGDTLYLPDKNSGKTYVLNITATQIGVPESVKLAPIIDENQCEVSDTLSTVDDCRLFV